MISSLARRWVVAFLRIALVVQGALLINVGVDDRSWKVASKRIEQICESITFDNGISDTDVF